MVQRIYATWNENKIKQKMIIPLVDDIAMQIFCSQMLQYIWPILASYLLRRKVNLTDYVKRREKDNLWHQITRTRRNTSNHSDIITFSEARQMQVKVIYIIHRNSRYADSLFMHFRLIKHIFFSIWLFHRKITIFIMVSTVFDVYRFVWISTILTIFGSTIKLLIFLSLYHHQ